MVQNKIQPSIGNRDALDFSKRMQVLTRENENLLSSEASVELVNGAETFTISRRGQRVAVHSSGQTHEEASRAGSWRPTACRIEAAAAGRLRTTTTIFLQRYY
jgi:hypothetical protein